MAPPEGSFGTKPPPAPVPDLLRLTAVILRTAFIMLLIGVTLRVSLPQSETIWTAYETTGDLIRLMLGIVVCFWLVTQLFQGPRNAEGYRTWLYLGPAAIPFVLICLFASW